MYIIGYNLIFANIFILAISHLIMLGKRDREDDLTKDDVINEVSKTEVC